MLKIECAFLYKLRRQYLKFCTKTDNEELFKNFLIKYIKAVKIWKYIQRYSINTNKSLFHMYVNEIEFMKAEYILEDLWRRKKKRIWKCDCKQNASEFLCFSFSLMVCEAICIDVRNEISSIIDRIENAVQHLFYFFMEVYKIKCCTLNKNKGFLLLLNLWLFF